MNLHRCKTIMFHHDFGGVRMDHKQTSRNSSVVEGQRYEAFVDVDSAGHLVEVLIFDKQQPAAAPIHVPTHRVLDYQLVDDPVKWPGADVPTAPETPKGKSEAARKVPAQLA